MNSDSSDNQGDDAAQVISEAIESSVRAWIVLARAPLLIYAQCLKMMARTVSDIANSLRSEKDPD